MDNKIEYNLYIELTTSEQSPVIEGICEEYNIPYKVEWISKVSEFIVLPYKPTFGSEYITKYSIAIPDTARGEFAAYLILTHVANTDYLDSLLSLDTEQE